MTTSNMAPDSIDDVQNLLRQQSYVGDRSLAVPIFLSLKLQRPLFLEGEAGVGKTEIAKALAAGLNTDLIRLQCYEGLDVTHAVYESGYAPKLPRQTISMRRMFCSESGPLPEKAVFSSTWWVSEKPPRTADTPSRDRT